VRSTTPIGAYYCTACHAKSVVDIIRKPKIIEEAADGSLYRLELILDAKRIPPTRLAGLVQETDEIIAMTVVSMKTLRKRDRHSHI
jgi:hypothetical protein